MKKSIRSIVLLSAVAVATVPSFAAMTGGNPRPQWPPVTPSVTSVILAAARAVIGI